MSPAAMSGVKQVRTHFAPPLLCIVMMLAGTPVGAQSSAQPPVAAAAVPATPVGAALRAWLDAYNSADSVRMAAYLDRYDPARTVHDALFFRGMTGAFNLLSIERSEARHVEFTVRFGDGPMTGYGAFELSPTEPSRLTKQVLEPLGPDASPAALRIDEAARARIIGRVSALLDSFYVFPGAASRAGDSLRMWLARGRYDEFSSGPGFAIRLSRDLAELAHDKHLNVRYVGHALPPERPDAGLPRVPSPNEVVWAKRDADERNCGFEKAERLDDNVGYLKVDEFFDPELCRATASAAMNFLASTRALIVDLRGNAGGASRMVTYIASYLFEHGTHMDDVWTRRTGKTEALWTEDSVAGRRFGGTKPVYVLTSARTFSAAEAFAYDLRALDRATIVGETTAGGAHPVRRHRIDDHVMLELPYARAINPVTHSNWEGVGVEPDVKVPAIDALEAARKIIRDKARRPPIIAP